ncbi:hypothetical protein [Nocardia yunnanensis]|uniref:hypothetical protein n=1 Tax=Nocardia yunnanensis TaxID=2382165 RepID=UPI0013C45CA2|nr:hypothetical protein [Nocardia yunnanensis]
MTEPQIPPGLFCTDQDNAPGGHIVYSLSEPVARLATPRVRSVGLFDRIRRAVYRSGPA